MFKNPKKRKKIFILLNFFIRLMLAKRKYHSICLVWNRKRVREKKTFQNLKGSNASTTI